MTDQQPDETDRRFAQNFRAARESASLSQREVAERMREAGIPFHQQTVYRVESGEQRVRIGEGAMLASIVGATMDELTRPPELALAAADIRSAARKVREERQQLSALTRRFQADADRLRDLLERARGKGIAGSLRTEFRVAMAALGEPAEREDAAGATDGLESGPGTADSGM